MFPAAGPISDRLRDQLHPDDPAWTPPRICPTPTRKAGDGWPVGRRTANPTRIRRAA